MTAWDQRQLCPDGACVGVIGDDGLCKVCGRAAQNWGDERKRGLKIEEPEEADEDDGEDEDEDDEDEDEGDEGDEGEDGDGDEDEDEREEPGVAATATAVEDDDKAYEWSRRRLCSNGACIGVIGTNGKCNVCGSTS